MRLLFIVFLLLTLPSSSLGTTPHPEREGFQFPFSLGEKGLGDEGEDYPTIRALQETIIPVNDPVDLAMRLRGVDEVSPVPVVERQVGDEEVLFIGDNNTTTAELRLISDTAYLWVGDNVPIPQEELQELATTFDTVIYPGVRELWGSEDNPGIDGDSRLHILFTRRLGPTTAAYFARRHTFPLDVMPASNQREMFFVNMDVYPLAIGSIMDDTLAHEFQHMIQENLDGNEDVWMNEGFSTFTELYLGYTGVFGVAQAFFSAPETQLNDFGGEGQPRIQNYGAGLVYTTYLYERFGIDGIKALGADPANGFASVNNLVTSVSEQTADDVFADWVVANVVMDKSLADGRFGYDLLAASFAPDLRDRIQRYPYNIKSSVSQYATDYFALDNWSDTVTITLDTPTSARLVPTDAAQNAWYSNRGDVSDMRLTRTFDLTDVDSATLNYNLWYAIEEGWDYGYIMVSTDDGEHWDILNTDNTTDFDPQDNAYGSGYTGESGGWISENVSLDDYVGQEIQVRFELITDDAVNLAGLLVDDVSIPEIGYSSNFETDDGGWFGEGWFITDNILPQPVWLQLIQVLPDDLILDRWEVSAYDAPLTANISPDAQRVIIAVSPFAPVTTVPMDYSITVDS